MDFSPIYTIIDQAPLPKFVDLTAIKIDKYTEKCHLLELPIEIRVMIYKLLRDPFMSDNLHLAFRGRNGWTWTNTHYSYTRTMDLFPIALSCVTTLRECLALMRFRPDLYLDATETRTFRYCGLASVRLPMAAGAWLTNLHLDITKTLKFGVFLERLLASLNYGRRLTHLSISFTTPRVASESPSAVSDGERHVLEIWVRIACLCRVNIGCPKANKDDEWWTVLYRFEKVRFRRLRPARVRRAGVLQQKEAYNIQGELNRYA